MNTYRQDDVDSLAELKRELFKISVSDESETEKPRLSSKHSSEASTQNSTAANTQQNTQTNFLKSFKRLNLGDKQQIVFSSQRKIINKGDLFALPLQKKERPFEGPQQVDLEPIAGNLGLSQETGLLK